MAALPGGGRLTHAAIVGLGGDVWAQSPEFPALSAAQLQAVVAGFGNSAPLATAGLWLGDVKYMLLRGEEGDVLRGRKDQGAAGRGGATRRAGRGRCTRATAAQLPPRAQAA